MSSYSSNEKKADGSKRRKLRNLMKFRSLVIGSTALLLIYFEYVTYFIQAKTWPKLECGYVKDTHKVLLVADPQILGENDESWIARLDSDRYLHKTFEWVIGHVEPDLILFLGDLMDEGSLASPHQYQRYYARFRRIFMLDYLPKNKTIFLPGDNDIGGENEEVTRTKVSRFNDHFGLLPSVVTYENLEFVKVNVMLEAIPKVNASKKDSIRILLSHFPLLGIRGFFGQQALSEMKPQLVFSAHDHKSMHLATGKDGVNRELVETLQENPEGRPGWRFQLGSPVNELVVPTSSYRMGVGDTAYAVALIDKKNQVVCYYLLWLPPRLHHLLCYLIFTVSVISISVIHYFFKFRYRSYTLTSIKVIR